MDLEVAGSSPVAHPISKINMTTMPIDWVGEKPEDADDWERIVAERAKQIPGGSSVRLRHAEGGWLVEAARKTSGDPVDFRWHITEALAKAGKPVIGVDTLQGGFPLSPEREAVIRASVKRAQEATPDPGTLWNKYDVQVVADLLAEIDRLRGKVQLAGLARDLAGRAASALTDACDDAKPRSARFRKA